MSLRLRIPKVSATPREVDVLIIGGGPAGFGAALYASRYRLSTIIVAESLGGQLNVAGTVENYLGFKRIQGTELLSKFQSHVTGYGVEIIMDKIERVYRGNDNIFEARTRRGQVIRAKSLIVAIGSKRRKLGVPGEKEFNGKGVSYCSVCDAPLYKGADAVVVVGGGDSAMEGALMLSDYAKKVFLVHRRDAFRAQPILVDAVKKRSNIEFILNSIVTEIMGDKKVNAVRIKNKITGEERVLSVNGIFIEIGFEPDKEFADMLGLETDNEGYIKVHGFMETNVEGVFAAGDCTDMWKGFRQIITSAAHGAVAAHGAYHYITKFFKR